MRHLNLLVLIFAASILGAQTAPDFTVTDTEGVVHQLYADHLDQGQTVVIELFFVQCPPCRSAAPTVQAKYVAWGEGEYDVEFFKLSTQSGDNNAKVAQFEAEFGLTFPGVGSDGGAQAARTPYQNGTFGPFFGTPQFTVVAADGTVNHGVLLSNLDAAIAATGATGTQTMEPEFTTIQLTTTTQNNTLPETAIFKLTSAAGGPVYNVTELTNGTNTFEYPSDMIPEMVNPILTLEVDGPVKNNSIKPPDLLRIIKHILEISVFTDPVRLLAADVNGDGRIKPNDLLTLQKIILELRDEFPNGAPSWRTIPESLPLTINVGQTVNQSFQMVKMGDVTF